MDQTPKPRRASTLVEYIITFFWPAEDHKRELALRSYEREMRGKTRIMKQSMKMTLEVLTADPIWREQMGTEYSPGQLLDRYQENVMNYD